ncbi:MAG: hypothetical protein R3185_08550, partial [Candidatus Thermoplasmatota archaeon]|nr:hypothetical protein [Candidatus Thermoplasmatota archaeon]
MASHLNAFALTILLMAASFAGCLGAATDEASGDGARTDEGATGSVPDKALDRRITVDIEALVCPDGYDNHRDDDICLGYNGQVPGPTWIFEQDELVQIELRHKVAETLALLDVEVNESTTERLTEGRYSMHRHGLSLDACNDGVARIEGTEICDSTVGPGETVTYTFRTAFPGDWHYHDHGDAFNGVPARDGIL